MFEKLSSIMGIPDIVIEEYNKKMNKWDRELKEFMIEAENKCRTYKQDHIEWSPVVKMWIARRWVLARVHKFIAKKKAWSLCRVKNLQRACRRHNMSNPSKMTKDELKLEKKICTNNLKELSKEAFYLRKLHLKQRRKKVVAEGDEENTRAISEIIK